MRCQIVATFIGAISSLLISGCNPRIRDAERLVSYDLYDPQSAQFREIEHGEGFVCGQYNAKNKMGGYTGYRGFMVKDGVAVLEPEENPKDTGFGASLRYRYELVKFDMNTRKLCGRHIGSRKVEDARADLAKDWGWSDYSDDAQDAGWQMHDRITEKYDVVPASVVEYASKMAYDTAERVNSSRRKREN